MMKCLEDLLNAEFQKLVPYKPLTAPEIVAIKNAFANWLRQEGEYASRCNCQNCNAYVKAMLEAVESLNIEKVSVHKEKIEGEQ